jgi:hypothetical protein
MKLRAPEGTSSVSIDGQDVPVINGFVIVRTEAEAATLASFGFVLAAAVEVEEEAKPVKGKKK